MWSKARLVAVHEGMIRHRGESPFDQEWLDRPDHDDRITTRSEIGDYLWARSGSLRAHATQVDPTEPWWFGLSDEQLAEVYPWEEWILARSLVGTPVQATIELDLFAGSLNTHQGWARRCPMSVQYRVSSPRTTRPSRGSTMRQWSSPWPRLTPLLDPTVAFMQGKLKNSGPTGPLLAALADGSAAAAISRLASRP